MILIYSIEGEIIGADKDFLQNYSLEELNQNFSNLILQKEYKINDITYDINIYPVENYKILVLSQQDNLININLPPIDNIENENIQENKTDEGIINLDSLLAEEENHLQNSNVIDISFDSLLEDDKQTQSNDSNDKEDSNIDNGKLTINLDSLIEENEIKNEDEVIPLDIDIKEENQNLNNLNISLASNEEMQEFKIPDNPLELMKKRKKTIGPKKKLKINFNIDEIKNKELDKDLVAKFRMLTKNKKEIEDLIHQELEEASIELGIDNETMQSFFDEIIDQLIEEKDIYEKALEDGNYKALHESTIKLKGALLNLRLHELAEIFSNLDDMIQERVELSKIEDLVHRIYHHLSVFLDDRMSKTELKVEIDMPRRDFLIRLRALQALLNKLKESNLDNIKSELNNMYKRFPLIQLKDVIDSKNEEEAKERIDNLINLIQKEVS